MVAASGIVIEGRTETDGWLSVERLIDHIQSLNPTARPEFLESFTRDELVEYLEHLSATSTPRGVGSERWLRRSGRRAIGFRRATR